MERFIGSNLNQSADFDDSAVISRVATVVAQRLKDKQLKEFRSTLPTKKRRKLLQYYYPLPRWLKPVAWFFLMVISLGGCFAILNYGLKFDMLFYATIPAETNIFELSQCPNTMMDISVNEWMQYNVDVQVRRFFLSFWNIRYNVSFFIFLKYHQQRASEGTVNREGREWIENEILISRKFGWMVME